MNSTICASNSDKNLSLLNSSIQNRSWEEYTSPSAIIEDPETAFHPAKDLYEKLPKIKELFTIHGKVGEGTFSSVYVATLNEQSKTDENKKLFAIKHLVPTCHPSRIERELRCLKLIGGGDNVIGVDFCLRINENTVFVMPFMRHEKFNDYFNSMDVLETIEYIKNLLIALKRVHSFGILHRDVKPSNFLYDRANKKFLLVDFGLAQELKTQEQKSNKRKLKNDDITQPVAKRIALAPNALMSPSKVPAPALSAIDKENINSPQVNVALKSPFKSPFKNYNCLSPNVSHRYNLSSKKTTPLKRSPYKNENKPFVNTPTSHIRKLSFESDVNTPVTSFIPPSDKCFTQVRNIPSRLKAVEKNNLANTKKGLNLKSKTEACQCYRKPKICNVCTVKKPQYAPRAGTPGFRPPEVLLKYNKQNTGVDIWAVGIIFMSILSGCYPFFKAADDLSALAEMITLFGTAKFENLAKLLGLQLTCSERRKPVDLKKLCIALRQRTQNECTFTTCKDCQTKKNDLCLCSVKNQESIYPNSAYDLLNKLLDVNPHTRISAEDALKHPFLS